MPPLTPLARRLRDSEDRALSPLTGWTRDTWALLADDLLLSARRFGTPSHGGIRFPGAEGGYGARVDALEGFARTFLAAGFRVAGEGGRDPLGLLEWYAEGITAGANPASPESERWIRIDEHHQAQVEAASIALVLQLTRPWLWDALDPLVQQQLVDYLLPAVDAFYPPINWIWFRIVIMSFLESVGVAVSRDSLGESLAFTDRFARDDGWYSDGEERSFDHYAGWALHFYPLLWSELAANDPEAQRRRPTYLAQASRFLSTALALVGADGSPLIQGRSLTYRFATAAPLWAAARSGAAENGQLGVIRRAASGMARHFVETGAPDADGILNLGWHGAWPRIAQSYSGPGSPYWASKGLLGLSLPPDHAVWTAVEQPLPVEQADQTFIAASPGWLVTSRVTDGVVRVVNHGTDHSVPGSGLRDSPLYARIGYSSATSPLLAGPGLTDPIDESVVLVDDSGRASSRTGFEGLGLEALPSGTLHAGSRWQTHWIDDEDDRPDHGFGRSGRITWGPALEVVSLVRRGCPWEVRLARAVSLEGAHHANSRSRSDLRLRVGGAGVPVSREDAVRASQSIHAVTTAVGERLAAAVADLGGLPMSGVFVAEDASPLAQRTDVPWRASAGAVEYDRWYAAGVALWAVATGDVGELRPRVEIEGEVATVTWPDGAQDRVRNERSARTT